MFQGLAFPWVDPFVFRFLFYSIFPPSPLSPHFRFYRFFIVAGAAVEEEEEEEEQQCRRL